MSLPAGIQLSKKDRTAFDEFPDFFRHALHDFYFLTEVCGFRKPSLSTWKNEGMLEFLSADLRISVQYESPGWVDVCFKKTDVPGRLYTRQLFARLGIPFEEELLRPAHSRYSDDPQKQRAEIEQDIAQTSEYLSRILSERREKIFSYLRDTDHLVTGPG